MTRRPTPPELLAPAGDFECLKAAVENGADAVYFGLDHGFNARARAANFSLESLPEAMGFLRHRSVRGYVTLNTLVFSNELAAIERTVLDVTSAGVDAVLVQDLGLARLIQAISPELEIHASTQMTLTSAETIEAARELGISRVVLARELSIDEIRKVSGQTSMPLEVFAHGALCVAYSGQCLTSESFGGRSANRGQCAQACRLPYDLICDGKDVDLGKVRYLLSPQDLAAYALVPELIEAGICSLKIEGRLKTPEYVANITRHYRQAIDTAWAGRPVEFTKRDVEEMELSFSRGFSPGWLQGCDHKMLVPGLSSSKRGVRLGQVTAIRGSRVSVQLSSSIAPGDGVVFDGDRASGEEQGGRVFEVHCGGRRVYERIEEGEVELGFDRHGMDLSRLRVGQEVWKTDEPELSTRLRKTFSGPDPQRRVPLDLQVWAETGKPLRIEAHAANGAACHMQTGEPLAEAIRHPLTAETLAKQLGRLGGTVYELRNLESKIVGSPMAPLSVLGQLRHAMVEQLEASISKPTRAMRQDSALAELRRCIAEQRQAEQGCNEAPRLHVLCRTLEQLNAATTLDAASLTADFQDIREYREAVQIGHDVGKTICLATPRIQKPDEPGIFRAMLRHGANGFLARNLAALRYFVSAGAETAADFSLNAANELTVAWLRGHGAARVTASYDLNREQLLDLVAATPPMWLEIVIHQHMPMFHMEHCVFCAVLSPGTNKTNCGRPCDRHEVRLRDRVGMEHPLKADVGCRNTLFNAVPQSAAEAVKPLLAQGVKDFRLEFLDEPPDALRRTFTLYQRLLRGEVDGVHVWRELKAANRVGVTRGTLEERRDPLAIL